MGSKDKVVVVQWLFAFATEFSGNMTEYANSIHVECTKEESDWLWTVHALATNFEPELDNREPF